MYYIRKFRLISLGISSAVSRDPLGLPISLSIPRVVVRSPQQKSLRTGSVKGHSSMIQRAIVSALRQIYNMYHLDDDPVLELMVIPNNVMDDDDGDANDDNDDCVIKPHYLARVE